MVRLYLPGEQEKQLEAIEAEKNPALHELQLNAPVFAWYRPDAQETQLDDVEAPIAVE